MMALEDRQHLASEFGLSFWNDRPSPIEFTLMDRILKLEARIAQLESSSSSSSLVIPPEVCG